MLVLIHHPDASPEGATDGLRLAANLAAEAGTQVRAFLMGGSVRLAARDDVAAHVEARRLLADLVGRGARVSVCRECLRERDLPEGDLVAGVGAAPGADLGEWRRWADREVGYMHEDRRDAPPDDRGQPACVHASAATTPDHVCDGHPCQCEHRQSVVIVPA